MYKNYNFIYFDQEHEHGIIINNGQVQDIDLQLDDVKYWFVYYPIGYTTGVDVKG